MSACRCASLLAAVFCASFLFHGCDLFGEDLDPSPPPASLRVNLTDNPTPTLSSAEVSISRVYLARLQGQAAAIELLPAEESPRTFDLLELTDDIEAMLAEAQVPPGSYDALHLVVSGAKVTLAGARRFPDEGRTRDLAVGPGGTRDVNVDLDEPLVVESGMLTLIVVDFPVEESFLVEHDTADPTLVHAVDFKPMVYEKRRHGVPLDPAELPQIAQGS